MGSPGILKLFARSPIRPLQHHMQQVALCAQALIPFIKATLADGWQEAQSQYQAICDLEHAADDLKLEVRLKLPKGLFLPVSRRDLLDLLDRQEQIANVSKDIAGVIVGREMHFPKAVAGLIPPYVQRCVDAVTQLHKAIKELDELLESGFSGREVQFIDDMIKTLNDIEHSTDDQQRSIRKAIFTIENEHAAVDIIFMYQIVDWIGSIADFAQQAGSRLRVITAG